MYESMIERVKHTQVRLRQQSLAAVFDEFDAGIMKLDPDSRRLKYAKMASHPFSFYRGSAYLFYLDVTREWFPYHTPADRPTWIQGDLHFENFGAFRSERGEIVYDVNDFDEGYLGSYLYDLLRMAVSIDLVCKIKGLDPEDRQQAIETYLDSYYHQIRRFSKGKEDPRSLVFDESRTHGPVRRLIRKLQKRSGHKFLETITDAEGNKRSFVWSEELQPAGQEDKGLLLGAWHDYVASLEEEDRQAPEYYRVKDIALKHGSGTASIGLDRYYILIEGGRAAEGIDDPVLEAKEVRVPVPAYFMPYNESFWEHFLHQGKRVVSTQRAMHHEADPFLGYLTVGDRHFYVRERSPYKKKLKLENVEDREELSDVLEVMGRITAKMHARADADVEKGILPYHSEKEIEKAMGDSCGDFCRTLSDWALSYSHQVEEDYRLFKDWVQHHHA
ncbi:DUF2252 domain-containing protein [Gorillibacterium sp. sgz5001074]|uniref:DUF2252 domain-containing protein n=1 Tax=Gorillibacterium sp. sgz5001074 TaxID=3446695 RepID=UPI003F663350